MKTIQFPGLPDDDLTGFVFSDLEVIGYQGRKTNGDGSKWVVRCKCGNYEVRRSQRLRRQRPDRIYRCQKCERRAQKLRNEEYLKLGYNRYDDPNHYHDLLDIY